MRSPWPQGFARIPEEGWVDQPVEELARSYDSVEDHGWYRNLDRTVTDLDGWLQPDHILLDYSGGTGILAARLLEEATVRGFGMLIADSSPKFLRLALEKLQRSERVAFRRIHYLKEEKRLQFLHEILPSPLSPHGVDAIVSTNAIHLYYDLAETLDAWHRVLKPGGRVFIQSGNIGIPYMPAGSWIIDETVAAIHRQAIEIVGEEDRWAAYRDGLKNADRMARYDELRGKFFLPVRPIDHYLGALEGAGFRIVEVTHLPIEAHVDQWFEFLRTYHEGVLGWVGGSPRIEGAEPTEAAIDDRVELIRQSMDRIFEGRNSFQALWTYVNAEVK